MSKSSRVLVGAGVVLGAIAALVICAEPSLSPSARGAALLWGPCVTAGLVTWILWAVCRPEDGPAVGCGDLLGPAQWDFSQSWASNFTLLGALLGTVLADSTLIPATPEYLEVKTYSTLNVLFAVATALSPLVYLSLGCVTHFNGEIRREGTVAGFVVAAWLTLWAALGQSFTLGVLLSEINRSSKFPPGGAYLILGFFGAGIWLLLSYFWSSVSALLKQSREAFMPAARPKWSPL